MKNLKLTIAALTIIFAVLVTNANENAEKLQSTIQIEFVTLISSETYCDLEKRICSDHILSTVSDIKMREDYNDFRKEKDALFEFETLDYLPVDFDAYSEDEAILAIIELLNEETDAGFEFSTSDYLPVNFNAYSEDEFNLAEFEQLVEEADATFEFDTLDYLPEDFNAYSEDESILAALELLNEEADETFDFNTLDYLPVNFYASK